MSTDPIQGVSMTSNNSGSHLPAAERHPDDNPLRRGRPPFIEPLPRPRATLHEPELPATTNLRSNARRKPQPMVTQVHTAGMPITGHYDYVPPELRPGRPAEPMRWINPSQLT